ncbi:MAG: response regulator transcription factor [Chloroflexi bacterium]|nr:response regulator transcription factor [Chloroflexota bacterium]
MNSNSLFCQATRRLLDDADGMTTVGEAKAGQQAMDLAQELQPEVILWSINNAPPPGEMEDDWQAMARIGELYPHSKIVVLSADSQERLALEAFRHGAQGYLVQGHGQPVDPTDLDEIVQAIHTVSQGGTVLSPRVAGWVLDEMSKQRCMKRDP